MRATFPATLIPSDLIALIRLLYKLLLSPLTQRQMLVRPGTLSMQPPRPQGGQTTLTTIQINRQVTAFCKLACSE